MGIKDLVNDTRTSIDETIASIVDVGIFSAAMHRLQQYRFWSTRSKPALWEHQRQAIQTVVAYLSADPHLPERPNLREAALLKLPTGTGKSGIIAVLARCLPNLNRTLVLTPRESLVEQMIDDVRFRFWGHLGYAVQEGRTFVADASEMGADLRDVYVERLLPSRSDRILQHVPAATNSVLVGTYQALDLIRRHSRDTRPALAAKSKAAQEILDLLVGFDLVLVDEGHYEPAVSWSKGVRDLSRATVLLSATPYRNDFKSFRVRGRFVFNYPHRDAVTTHVIRDTKIVPIGIPRSGSTADKFVGGLARCLPPLISQSADWTDAPKIMVRADDLDTLQDLQGRIDRTFRTKSVLVHDRAKPSPKYPRRYQSVRRAMQECADARFWLHQYKLMEGVDDPHFIVAAIYDLHTNGRQLIQQIGRVVRTSPGRTRKQTAWVVATQENAQRIVLCWRKPIREPKQERSPPIPISIMTTCAPMSTQRGNSRLKC